MAMRQKKRLIFGIGINDANYQISERINGKKVTCAFYMRWTSMMIRCYSKKFHAKYPTYGDCYVSNDWLYFSKFKLWMEKQDWKDKDLDKDILVQGNKIYSEDTCLFVCHNINSLINENKSRRGLYPQGVSWHKSSGKIIAQCRVGDKKIHIGSFDSVDEAYEAYKKFKYKVIKEVAKEQEEPLMSALLRYKIDLI